MIDKEITLVNEETDLSSRVTGVAVRDAMLADIGVGENRVSVDCVGIRTLSESFADEVFGILVAERGKAWFKQRVAVTGFSETTRAAILRAIAERLHLNQPALPMPDQERKPCRFTSALANLRYLRSPYRLQLSLEPWPSLTTKAG